MAVLGHAARCLRGDVLRYRHGLHGLERRRVCSGEAAAHALIDRVIPGENALLSQCALLAAHWGKMIQALEPESIDHVRQHRCYSDSTDLRFNGTMHSL